LWLGSERSTVDHGNVAISSERMNARRPSQGDPRAAGKGRRARAGRAAAGLLCAGLSAATVAPASSAPAAGDSVLTLREVGRHAHGVFGQSGAEIAAFDPASRRLFVVNGSAGRPTIDVLELDDAASPSLRARIPVDSLYGGGANSVAARRGVVAVAVENRANRQAPGRVVFLDATGALLGQVIVGAQPDMLTFTPDGSAVLVCNEGEPDPSYASDPEGSVSVIDLAGGIAGANVTTIRFTAFDAGGTRHAELPAGVRVYGPGSSVAQDLEPEYVAVAPDGRRAWVSLQENNALAILDLRALRVEAIVALGLKDHRLPGQGLDPSDRDGAHAVAPWPVFGMYQPDALAAFEAAGGTYLVVADEGDARRYAALDEVSRVADLALDPAAFPDASALKKPEALGRLQVTNRSGDTDGDGDFDELHAFGGRSVSIRDSSGALVWDSGELLERLTAALDPERLLQGDDRSDDKGPQAEGVAVGEVGGRTWAFVGLERMGGVVVFELSDPRAPRFHSYVDPRDFAQAGPGAAGDEGPEGVLFIPAADSPTNRPLLVVCNEVSGTTTIFAPELRAPGPAGLRPRAGTPAR
jgi:2',3'-cyclic-nucleotide 2'-phosphodiesterase/3'-nucleotidase/5'-nucleotidase